MISILRWADHARAMTPSPTIVLALVTALGLFTSSPADAQSGAGRSIYGPHIGLSADPDQLVIGVFAELAEFTPDLALRPSADVGFGDNVLTLILNADVQYAIPAQNFPAMPYVGMGLGLAYYDFKDLDPGVPSGAGHGRIDDTETEIGLNLLVGIEKELAGYKSARAEIRFGIDELPDFKFMVGLGFY
jgi:hypothetical protein